MISTLFVFPLKKKIFKDLCEPREKSVVVCPGGDGGFDMAVSQCVDSVVREKSVVVCPGGDGGFDMAVSQCVHSTSKIR